MRTSPNMLALQLSPCCGDRSGSSFAIFSSSLCIHITWLWHQSNLCQIYVGPKLPAKNNIWKPSATEAAKLPDDGNGGSDLSKMMAHAQSACHKVHFFTTYGFCRIVHDRNPDRLSNNTLARLGLHYDAFPARKVAIGSYKYSARGISSMRPSQLLLAVHTAVENAA